LHSCCRLPEQQGEETARRPPRRHPAPLPLARPAGWRAARGSPIFPLDWGGGGANDPLSSSEKNDGLALGHGAGAALHHCCGAGGRSARPGSRAKPTAGGDERPVSVIGVPNVPRLRGSDFERQGMARPCLGKRGVAGALVAVRSRGLLGGPVAARAVRSRGARILAATARSAVHAPVPCPCELKCTAHKVKYTVQYSKHCVTGKNHRSSSSWSSLGSSAFLFLFVARRAFRPGARSGGD
jgi:hypothetical protein